MFLISSNRLKLYINSLHLSLLYPFFDAVRLDMGKDRNYYIYIEEIHMDKWRQRPVSYTHLTLPTSLIV